MKFAAIRSAFVDAITVDCRLEGRGGENIHVRLITENSAERGRAIHCRTKEPEILTALIRHTKPGEIFWDIGANVGLYSLFAAKLGLSVYAFEPHIPNAHKLLRNREANGLSHSVKLIPIALGESERMGSMYVSSLDPGSSLHQFAATQDQAGRPSGVSVPIRYGHGMFCTTVDRLVREWRLPEPHHVKIDVDGNEDNVIEGMKGVLRAGFDSTEDFETFPYAGRLRSVISEVHDDALERTRSFMRFYGLHEDADYPETSRLREKRRAAEEGGRWAGYGNCVFVRRNATK